jgi:hypothetical protein
MNLRIVSTTALLVSLAGCSTTSTVTPSTATAVAGDLAMLVSDIQADVASKTLTAAQVATINTEVTQLQTDVSALNLGTPGVTANSALTDFMTAVSVIGEWLPEIEALVAIAGTPTGHASTPLALKAQADFASLKRDVAAAH